MKLKYRESKVGVLCCPRSVPACRSRRCTAEGALGSSVPIPHTCIGWKCRPNLVRDGRYWHEFSVPVILAGRRVGSVAVFSETDTECVG